ncbi:TetR/AcrR family transcriptional regulator [Gracilibacillus orientalis]|nr:TetR/AcrR family transcriptional regulator [Gracilibacillus orientalis]
MINKKSQIIELTLKNIKDKGFLSFSYDDLAKELGVTKASIHYHFEKKGDLGIAVCNSIEEGLEKAFSEVKQASIKPLDKPLAFISNRILYINKNDMCPISALQADYNYLPASMQKKIQKLSQMEIDFLTELLFEAKKEGYLEGYHDNLEELAILLIASTKGGLQYKRILGDEFFTKLWEQFTDFLK